MNSIAILLLALIVGASAATIGVERDTAACCDVCKNATARVAEVFESPRLKKLLHNLVTLPCKFKVDKHACEMSAVERIDQFLANLTSEIQNPSVCIGVGCCDQLTTLSQIEQVLGYNLDCKHCAQLTEAVANAMKTTNNANAIELAAVLECSKFPAGISDFCLVYVNNNITNIIWAVRTTNNNPEKARHLLKFCPAMKSSASMCEVCESLLVNAKRSMLIEAQLAKNTMEMGCKRMGHVAQECVAMVDGEVATITATLEKLLAPNQACKSLRLC